MQDIPFFHDSVTLTTFAVRLLDEAMVSNYGAVVGGGVGSLAGPTGSAGAGGGALVGESLKVMLKSKRQEKPFPHLLMEMWRL